MKYLKLKFLSEQDKRVNVPSIVTIPRSSSVNYDVELFAFGFHTYAKTNKDLHIRAVAWPPPIKLNRGYRVTLGCGYGSLTVPFGYVNPTQDIITEKEAANDFEALWNASSPPIVSCTACGLMSARGEANCIYGCSAPTESTVSHWHRVS